jgi:hypothetical protein
MRRTLSFILASALLAAGSALLAFEVFQAPVIRGLVLLGSGLMIAAGGGWLVEDFFRPLWRRTKDH